MSFVQVQSLIQLLVNIWKILLQTLKKIHYFPYISWYCTIFAFCFWTGNKLLMSATTANTSQNVRWSVIVSDYIEQLNRYILTKIIYMDTNDGQLELCPRFVKIWGLYCQRPNNKNLLPIHAIKNVDHRPVLVLVLVLINQYSYSYLCNNQVLVLVLTHIASTRTCTHTRKSGTRPSPVTRRQSIIWTNDD